MIRKYENVRNPSKNEEYELIHMIKPYSLFPHRRCSTFLCFGKLGLLLCYAFVQYLSVFILQYGVSTTTIIQKFSAQLSMTYSSFFSSLSTTSF